MLTHHDFPPLTDLEVNALLRQGGVYALDDVVRVLAQAAGTAHIELAELVDGRPVTVTGIDAVRRYVETACEDLALLSMSATRRVVYADDMPRLLSHVRFMLGLPHD